MTRDMQFAGTFYPQDKNELLGLIHKYLDNAKPVSGTGTLKALIIPHAGYPYSGPVASFGYKLLQNKKFKEIILLGPSHQIPVQGLAFCDYKEWETPLGKVSISDKNNLLAKEKSFHIQNEAHLHEHSIEVQLPFLQIVLESFSIIPIATGFIEKNSEIAEILSKYISKATLLIVSSDLSHYLPYAAAQSLDRKTINSILSGNTNISHDQACGADGITILMKIAKKKNWKATLLDYRNSGDTAGMKDQVVGYTSIAFYD
jgi:AmmeMemoRadiSam system protein B